MEKHPKTNAVRLLETAGVPFSLMEYEVSEDDLSGTGVARKTGLDPDRVFKTLVTTGEKGGVFVFCIPVAYELDLKKAAAACGAKKIHLEGNGLGAIPALFAAVLSGKVATLRLTNAPESYTAECRKPVTPLPLSCIVPGILKEMDLPDIRRWLGRTLTVIETHR